MHKAETSFLSKKKKISLGFLTEPSWALPMGRPTQVILTRTPHLPKLEKAQNLDTAVHKPQNLQAEPLTVCRLLRVHVPHEPSTAYIQPTLTPLQMRGMERGQQMVSAAMLTSERGRGLWRFLVRRPNQSRVQNIS